MARGRHPERRCRCRYGRRRQRQRPVNGGSDGDSLEGGAGADTLRGGQGKDALDGGDGDDRVFGDRGADTLTGGNGDDVFVFQDESGIDLVADFKLGSDQLEIASDVNGSGIIDFASFLDRVSDIAGNAVVDLGGGASITLVGIAKKDLDGEDLLIV